MILKACAFGLIAAVTGQLLGEGGFKGKRFFSVLCIIGILVFVVDGVASLVAELSGFISEDAMDITKCAMKIVGAGYVFGISADIASELGEGGISKALLAVGRVEIIVMSFPYFKNLFELGAKLIK